MFSSIYGGLTHNLKGNVDISMVALMLDSSIIGAWIGPIAVKHLEGSHIRLLFWSVCWVGSNKYGFQTLGKFFVSEVLIIASQIVIFGLAGSLCCLILAVIAVKDGKAQTY